MARSFILGGVSATGLATGKPYVKRIVRKGSNGAAGSRADGFTCVINGDGAISFDVSGAATDGAAKDWVTTGELLFVEFPATTRTFSVQAEGANEVGAGKFRLKVMLTAPGQKAFALDSNGNVTTQEVTLDPIPADQNDGAGGVASMGGNFIEINFTNSEIATINARTKGVFVLIEKYANDNIFLVNGNIQGKGGASHADDAVSILVTAILDHEGFDGSNGVQTKMIQEDGTETRVTKMHPLGINSTDGVG